MTWRYLHYAGLGLTCAFAALWLAVILWMNADRPLGFVLAAYWPDFLIGVIGIGLQLVLVRMAGK